MYTSYRFTSDCGLTYVVRFASDCGIILHYIVDTETKAAYASTLLDWQGEYK